MLSEVGYNPYASCLVCTEKYLQANETTVRKMVRASVRGWQKYLSDPDETNHFILKQNNQGMTLEALKYGVEKMKPLCLPESMAPEKLGAMSLARWQQLRDQLTELKLIRADRVDATKAFTDQFLER